MKKLIVILFLVLVFVLAPVATFAANVTCPEHSYATCYDTGITKMAADGGMLHKYHCTCGDEWWVRE